MKKENFTTLLRGQFAIVVTYVLSVVLFVCANTNSCCMVYQPEVPEGLEHFSKIQ